MKISTLFLPRKEQPVRCWVPAVKNRWSRATAAPGFLMQVSSEPLLSNTELGNEPAKAVTGRRNVVSGIGISATSQPSPEGGGQTW